MRTVELFFDLVYVLAITQLTHHLLEHLTVRGAVETALLLLAVWAAWNYTSWTTNYFEPNAVPVRLTLFGLMFVSLIMSAAIPSAFGGRGLAFAGAYVALTIGRTLAVLVALGREYPLAAVFARPLLWWSSTGAVWIAGAFAEGDARLALWAVAVAVEYLGLFLGYPVPRHGATRSTEYTIAGEHMADRCQLFVILGLGESILISGANFGDLPGSAATVTAFAIAFLGTLALWWAYFDRGAEAGIEAIAAAKDPGRLGLVAYTWAHIPLVAGIIVVAAGDELAIGHPRVAVGTATAAVILGGPALFLLGHAWFKRSLWGTVSRSRIAALVALAALVPLAAVASAVVLLGAATAVLVAMAVWDAIGRFGAGHDPREKPWTTRRSTG